VMGVVIEDQHAFALRRQGRRGNCDVVDHAEAHRLVRRGVMPRGTHRTERGVGLTILQSLHGRQTGAGREDGRLP